MLQNLSSIYSYLNLIDIVMKLILWTIMGKYLVEEIFNFNFCTHNMQNIWKYRSSMLTLQKCYKKLFKTFQCNTFKKKQNERIKTLSSLTLFDGLKIKTQIKIQILKKLNKSRILNRILLDISHNYMVSLSVGHNVYVNNR